jgi:hydrogenase maturation protease
MTTDACGDRRILVAGIGNIFLGDDAFGVEVVQRLSRRPQAANVTVRDFGIRGLDLAYTLLDGFDPVILVDALPRGGEPGTLCVLEPELDHKDDNNESSMLMQGHNMDPVQVFQLVKMLGGKLPKLILVGCEPAPSSEQDDFAMTMSRTVGVAVEEAVSLIEALLEKVTRGENSSFVGRVLTRSFRDECKQTG